MADKSITLSELRDLEDEGAEVSIDRRAMKIERLDDLIAALNSMVANEAERIRADIARNQTNLEILATLQKMVKSGGTKIQPADLTPVMAMLEEMRGEREAREQGAYEFEVHRDGRGFAQKITATPVTKH